jgi:hypothetical protein
VKPHGDLAAAVGLRQQVVVVPAELPGPAAVAVGPDAAQFHEMKLARIGQLADPDRSGSGVEPELRRGSIGEADLLVLDMDDLLHPPALGTPRLPRASLECGDPIDRHQAQVPEQDLMVNPSKGCVVHDGLGARNQWGEPVGSINAIAA